MTIHTEKIILHEDRNVSLVAMVQDCGGEFGKITARPAVLILPGGGYSMCSDREAEPVAYPYLAAGYQAFVLRYSIGEHKAWPNPLNDYEEAMTMIRGKAEEWHIIPDRIAVIGFSAGGHLAAAAATSAINRPNAAILGYAATGRPLTDAMHPVHKAVVPNEAVDDQTCPCFIFAARDDTMVPVEENSVPFMQALAEHAIMYESHIYSYGGHGYSTGNSSIGFMKQSKRIPNWVNDSIGWLDEVFGTLSSNGMSQPVLFGKMNADREEMLSVDCTVGLLRSVEEASPLLTGVLAATAKVYPTIHDEHSLISGIVKVMKLRELMGTFGSDEASVKAMDSHLRQIPNPRKA